MSSGQHVTTEQQETLENQRQSTTVEIVEVVEDDDPFAEFSWVTGHDVDDSEEDSDANTNTLSLAAIVVNTDSQKRNRGAPKMQKQKRVTHHYTELVYSAKSKADLTKRRSNLGFVLKKTSNNCKLTAIRNTLQTNLAKRQKTKPCSNH